ncbi:MULTISPECIES: zinc-binding dehydrogenase [unclassified Ensifer]|uniref:quinone oxidoreductase family protein n=1 Tax=unclassified Ensifer TaxID=2633371 RepID=UPI000813AF9A|nr:MULTISPECIES: zinc-binding dehydrogenase [unclassified Ensifer]OCP15397.1 NADPH:quinone oxidoreductase [Ensifer sp. LC384]OCP21619.1 NADPH:quinone oxidoreductase [Ensifer sp. LC54]
MKAIEYRTFGGPEVLQLIDMPKPLPARGEALMRVGAIGLNFFEVLMRQDRYAVTPDLPMAPGVEVAGIVEALGAGVKTPAVGMRVAVPMFAFGRGAGGCAEYVAIDADALVPIPDEVSFEVATALMIQGLTALHLVRQSDPRGKTVLVTAAAGGVGSLLIQLAREAGAKTVIGLAGGSEKVAFARSLGADLAIDYRAADWHAALGARPAGGPVETIYDMVGGSVTKSALGVLAQGGDLVFGAMGRFELETADIEQMLSANQSLRGFALLPSLTPSTMKADLCDLFRRVVEGRLKVHVGGRFPLGQAAEAHRAMETRSTIGKIVLVP